MENKQKYLWRENDFSSKTNLRYDLEAEHWVKAFKGATPSPTASITDIFSLLRSVFLIIYYILWLVGLFAIEIANFVIKHWPRKKVFDPYEGVPTFDNRKPITSEEFKEMVESLKGKPVYTIYDYPFDEDFGDD